MPDPLSSVVAGQPLEIRASTWNALLAAARDRRQPPRPDRPTPKVKPTGHVEALGFNDTGADLAAFKPAKVTGSGPYTLHSASESQAYDWNGAVVVTLDTPSNAGDIIAVTLEGIPDGQFGRVAVGGWCACDVEVTSAAHTFARPGAGGADKLTSASTGPVRIINTGTGAERRTACYLFLPDSVGQTPTRTAVDFCVEKSGGNVTDIRVTWLYTDGTTECETVASCSGGACDAVWYCTPDGPESVAVGAAPPAGWTSGPYPSEVSARASCPYVEVLVSGCATPYPTTITMTFSGYTGGCAGFNGSVDLDWNGTAWTGVYAAPAGNVTCTVTPSAGGGGTVNFTDSYSSSAYTVSGGGTAGAGCGAYPAGGVRTLTGGCTGGGTMTISA